MIIGRQSDPSSSPEFVQLSKIKNDAEFRSTLKPSVQSVAKLINEVRWDGVDTVIGIPVIGETWFLPSLLDSLKHLGCDRKKVGVLLGLPLDPTTAFLGTLIPLMLELRAGGFASVEYFRTHWNRTGFQPFFERNKLRVVDIAVKRETIRRACLGADVPQVLWLDADMVAPPNTLESLLSRRSKADVVAGICCMRKYPDLKKVDSRNPAVFVWDLDQRYRAKARLAPNGLFVAPDEMIVGPPFYADQVGFGCVLTSRLALEKADFLSALPLKTEDMIFCEGVRRAGLKILVDTSVQVGHLQQDGHVVYFKDRI